MRRLKKSTNFNKNGFNAKINKIESKGERFFKFVFHCEISRSVADFQSKRYTFGKTRAKMLFTKTVIRYHNDTVIIHTIKNISPKYTMYLFTCLRNFAN